MKNSKEYSQYWRDSHLGYKAKEGKLYRSRHPERNKISCGKWYRKNKAYHMNQVGKRRTLQQTSTTGCTKKILKIYKRAIELKEWFDVVVDHVIPLSRGGLHSADNLQIIYAYENARKGNSLDYKPRVIFK